MSLKSPWERGALVLLGVMFVASCRTTVEYTRDPEIRYQDARDRYEDVALHKVFRDGALVGYCDEKRLRDGDSNDFNDRYEIFVQDTNRDIVGFVTDKGEAYRLRAHGPSELVGLNSDLRRNVKAIFGFAQGEVTIQKMVYVEK